MITIHVFICFLTEYGSQLAAVKTPVGAVAKTHRFVWRPQEVASRGVVGFENIHEFK